MVLRNSAMTNQDSSQVKTEANLDPKPRHVWFNRIPKIPTA